jgi:hypothetical protein
MIEVILNRTGILAWTYRHRQWPRIYFVVSWWTIPCFCLARMHDHLPMKTKRRLALIFPTVAIAMRLVFANILGWV